MGSALDAVIGNPPGERKAMVGLLQRKFPWRTFCSHRESMKCANFASRANPGGKPQGSRHAVLNMHKCGAKRAVVGRAEPLPHFRAEGIHPQSRRWRGGR